MLSAKKRGVTPAGGIKRREALDFTRIRESEVEDLFSRANRVRETHRGKKVDLCSIVNAKSGACPEDCSFCAQSARSRTDADTYSLISREKILDAARAAQHYNVKRFCVVTSGRSPNRRDLESICTVVAELRGLGMLPCATLGMLDDDQLKQLRDAGLNRYHHNLETSENFFSEICTTHTYRDKIRTIESAQSLGLSVCSGGIFGLGESWEDRIDMAFALRDLNVDSIPINFFTPIAGTPLGKQDCLEPLEALKIVALYRLIIPDKEIRVCGGRPATLRELHSHIFRAGADGLLIGNYLTTLGRDPSDDIRMIHDLELEL